MKTLLLGNIITIDDNNPLATALICDKGIIEYVGSKEEAYKKCADGDIKVLDYGDNYIYPGFLESHTHGLFAGYRTSGQADLTNCFDDKESMIEVIKEFINDNPQKEVYVAQGWNETTGPLDYRFLDNILNDKPLVLNTGGGHSCLLNSKAMEYYGINKETLNKYGSDLVRIDENGELTGYICEEPAIKLIGQLPISFEEGKNFVLKWQDIAFSKGITAVGDAGAELIYKKANEVYKTLDDENKLKLRTYSYSLIADNEPNPKEAIENVVELKKKFDGKHFEIIGVKAFLDGVLEARTSWTVEGYADDSNYHGLQRFADLEKMIELIKEASKNNLAVHVHSEGDGATKFMLDCIEESIKETNDYDQRNVLAHLHIVKENDIKRMGETKSIPAVPPLWTPKFPGGYEKEVGYVGEERAFKSYPIKSFFSNGCKVVYHSDYPVSPILDISRSVFMAETRAIPEPQFGGIEKTTRNKQEAVSRMESLKALTINIAYMFKKEKEMGSIEKGKMANFAVLDKDLLNVDILEIPNTKTIATIVDGEEVFHI